MPGWSLPRVTVIWAVPLLPARSVAVAVMRFSPLSSGTVAVNAPPAASVAARPLTTTRSTSPPVAVPWTSVVAALMVALSAGESMVTPGPCRSMLNVTLAGGVVVWP